jgi:cytosine/adenosine deaminase-related metal-dependent hydrolase
LKRRVLLKNGNVVGLEPLKVEAVDLLVQDGRVVERRPRIDVGSDTAILDCRGRLILPGLVDANTELHLSQSLGLPPSTLADENDHPRLRENHLRRAVESAHQEETLVTAAFAGGLEALRNGTTTVVDLHHTPAVENSLDLVRDALLTVGLRAVLGYRTESGDERIASSLRFAEQNRSDAIAGILALTAEHILAQDDLSDLREKLTQSGSRLGVSAASAQETESVIRALEAAELLGPNLMMLRAPGITKASADLLRATRTWTIHAPSAEALDAEAQLPFESLEDFVAIGSRSARSDVLGEARLAFHRARARGLAVKPEDVIRLLVGGQQLASELLRVELGSTRREAGADFAIFNYHPRTPIRSDNLADHLLFGVSSQDIETVMVDGLVVYRNGRFPEVDTRRLAPLMRRGARQLWEAVGGESE